jgi:hypothetical protein
MLSLFCSFRWSELAVYYFYTKASLLTLLFGSIRLLFLFSYFVDALHLFRFISLLVIWLNSFDANQSFIRCGAKRISLLFAKGLLLLAPKNFFAGKIVLANPCLCRPFIDVVEGCL